MATNELTAIRPVTTGTPMSAAFRDQVTQELRAFVTALADQYAEESRRSTEMLRQAIATALSQAEAASAPSDAGTAELSGDSVLRLLGAAEAYANECREDGVAHACATIATLRGELEQQVQQAQDLRRIAEELKSEAQALRADVTAEQQLTDAARKDCALALEAQKAAEAERDQLEERRADENRMRMEAEREAAEMREAAGTAREELARVATERDAAVEAQEEASRTLATVTQQLREAEEQRDRASALLEASSLHLASVKRMNAEHDATIRDLESRLARAGEQAASASGSESAESFHANREKVFEQALEFVSLSLDRLSMVFDAFAGRASVDEVFDAVATTLASEFSRVVLFNVTSHGLEAVRSIGLDESRASSEAAIPPAVKSLVRAAAASRTTEALPVPELPSGDAPYGGSATVAVAVPIALEDGPIVVVYADDADQPHRELVNADLRVKFAELVRRHADPLLARLAIERQSLAALDSYATSLVKHLKSTHSADMLAAIPDEERRSRLSQNVAYARRVYAQRAESSGARASSILEDQLRAAADVRPPTSFSKDLSGIMADDSEAPGLATVSVEAR